MRRTILIALALVALALTSCELGAEVSVEPDGSGTMAMYFGIEKSLAGMMPGNEDPFADARADLEDDPVDWTFEEYERDGLVGFRASFAFTSIEDLKEKAAQMDEANAEGPAGGLGEVTLEKGSSGWVFSVSGEGFEGLGDLGELGDLGGGFGEGFGEGFGGPPPGGAEGFEGFEGFDPSDLLDAIDIQFRVTLPGAPGEHNASEVSQAGGRTTFVWKPTADDAGPQTFSAKTVGFGGSSFPVVPVATGAGVVALAAGGVMLSRRKSAAVPPPLLEGPGVPMGAETGTSGTAAFEPAGGDGDAATDASETEPPRGEP